MMQSLIAALSFVIAAAIFLFLSNHMFQVIQRRRNRIHVKFLNSALDAVIVVLCVYACLSQFEITKDISKTIFQGGTLILALATFAAQQALGNVISGFALSVGGTFEIGDKIKVLSGGSTIVEGFVTSMTLRQTTVAQYNGETCIVPNSVMDSSVIINANYTKDMGNYIEVGIAYDADVDKASRILKEIIVNEPLSIRKDETSVLLTRFEASSVVLKTTLWTRTLNDNFAACDHVRREILKQFPENGIEIPFNTVTVVQKDSGHGSA